MSPKNRRYGIFGFNFGNPMVGHCEKVEDSKESAPSTPSRHRHRRYDDSGHWEAGDTRAGSDQRHRRHHSRSHSRIHPHPSSRRRHSKSHDQSNPDSKPGRTLEEDADVEGRSVQSHHSSTSRQRNSHSIKPSGDISESELGTGSVRHRQKPTESIKKHTKIPKEPLHPIREDAISAPSTTSAETKGPDGNMEAGPSYSDTVPRAVAKNEESRISSCVNDKSNGCSSSHQGDEDVPVRGVQSSGSGGLGQQTESVASSRRSRPAPKHPSDEGYVISIRSGNSHSTNGEPPSKGSTSSNHELPTPDVKKHGRPGNDSLENGDLAFSVNGSEPSSPVRETVYWTTLQ